VHEHYKIYERKKWAPE